MKIKNLKQLEEIISRIPSRKVLDSFIELNIESLKEFMMPKRHREENEEGKLYCSECNYIFKGEEANWVYCAGCLKEIACCDNPDTCDKLGEELEEAVYFTLKELYKKTRTQ